MLSIESENFSNKMQQETNKIIDKGNYEERTGRKVNMKVQP